MEVSRDPKNKQESWILLRKHRKGGTEEETKEKENMKRGVRDGAQTWSPPLAAQQQAQGFPGAECKVETETSVAHFTD